jgi:L-lactate dehydrogenase complex protein LldG
VSAREEILARVRTALADVPRAAEPRGAASTAAGDCPAEDEQALAARFAERASEYRATVRRAEPGGLDAAIAQVCAEHAAGRVAVPPGLPTAWTPPGVELIRDDGLTPGALDALDGVLTGCALAIAETGTIVLDGGPTCGRRALTLVPDLHVCIVEVAQVVSDLPAAFAALAPTRPLTFVSGPSATSDIELNRVEGVHGPRRLEIVLLG